MPFFVERISFFFQKFFVKGQKFEKVFFWLILFLWKKQRKFLSIFFCLLPKIPCAIFGDFESDAQSDAERDAESYAES